LCLGYCILPVRGGGDRGTRTPDLCDANAALSQLSYIPKRDRNIITYPAYVLTQDFLDLVAYFARRHIDLYGISVTPAQQSFTEG
jgi:hypothetical protein